MVDKQHCFMNPDDEHEYEGFYDFSKAYEGFPQKEKLDAEEIEDEEWEDDGEIVEEEDETEENKTNVIDSQQNSESHSFSIIDSEKQANNSEAFHIIDSPSKQVSK